MVTPHSPPATIYNSSPGGPSPGEVVQIPDAVRARCGYSPYESISPKCNWTAQPCFVLSAQQPKGRCFGALAQCGDSKPTHPFSLVYAHSPQPKTLSLNQWMPPPKKIGLGGGYMKAIQCSCMLVVPPPPPLGGDSHLAAQPWGIAGDHYMLGGR